MHKKLRIVFFDDSNAKLKEMIWVIPTDISSADIANYIAFRWTSEMVAQGGADDIAEKLLGGV